MKTKMNLLKTAVLALVLAAPAQIFAQTPGQFPTAPTGKVTQASDLNGGLVTFNGTNESFAAVSGTTMFYRPTSVDPAGSGVNLSASLKDAAGNSFSSYLWYKVTYDSTAGIEDEGTAIPSVTTNLYSPTNLAPGYNKFRVRGETGSSVSSCPSTEYQDVIVFVLPELDVTPTVNGTELVYCVNDVPSGANEISLSTGTITADYTGNTNDYPKPGLTNADADFALTYDWYAVPQGGGTAISLGNSATVNLSTAANPLTPGTYEFYVDVKYNQTIRDENVGGVSRPYVVYGGSTVVTSQTVTVTDTPGTPTITVVGVDD